MIAIFTSGTGARSPDDDRTTVPAERAHALSLPRHEDPPERHLAVLAGLGRAGYLLAAVLLAITIIGLPFAKQSLKLAGTVCLRPRARPEPPR